MREGGGLRSGGRKGRTRDLLIRYVLSLYYTLVDSRGAVPSGVKAALTGARGYLIYPLDVIPDSIPVAGFTDDLVMVAAVMSLVASHIPPDAKRIENEKLHEWFGTAS